MSPRSDVISRMRGRDFPAQPNFRTAMRAMGRAYLMGAASAVRLMRTFSRLAQFGHRQAIHPAQGTHRARPAPRHHARHASRRHRVPAGLTFSVQQDNETATSSRAGATPDGRSRRWRRFCGRPVRLTAVSAKPPCTQLTLSSAVRARREHRIPKAPSAQDRTRP